jgi:hypothetical protein
MRRYSTFLRLLDEDPVFLERVRQKILTRDLLGLPVLVAQVLDLQRQTLEALRGFMEATDRRFAAAEAQIRENGRQIASLTEQVRENSRQIAALTEALREFREAAERRFAAAEAQIAENGRRIATLTDRVEENSRQIGTLEGRVGWLMGHGFEQRFLDWAAGIFRGGGDLGPALRRTVDEARKREAIAEDDWRRLRSLDLLWGRGGTVFVGEVSEAVKRKDVFRALRAVEILGRLGWGRGLRLLPVVVGRKVGRVPKRVGWVRFDPDEEVLEISPGIETILREEGPEPVEPERFFGGGADDSPLREA